MEQVNLNRRRFLVSTAAFSGGMALSLMLPNMARAASAGSEPWVPARQVNEFSPWVALTADDQVIVRVTHPEIGNGALTQVAMTVTEELACDWSKVKVEHASVRRDYLEGSVYSIGSQPYFGGHSTTWDRMKHALQVGASIRERLRAAAAEHWSVPVREVEARNSVLTHLPTARTLRFGEMAAKALAVQLDEEPALKPQSEWSFLGKATPAKLHLPQIVNGSATFGVDVRLPGMIYAAVKQCPVHGGRLLSHDPDAVLAMPGVRAVVVLDPAKTVGSPLKDQATFGLAMTETLSGVAVVADHYWQARKALDALPIEWDLGPGQQWKETQQLYDAIADKLDEKKGDVVLETGDVAGITPEQTVEAMYRTPFCEHMAMEPLNGTALYSEDKLEVWYSCQDSKQAYWVAIDESGFLPEQVYFNQTFVGGGFGRRTFSGDLRTVVSVAREVPGIPVQVIFSREECTQQGRYRIMVNSQLKAGLNSDGLPSTWEGDTCYAGAALIPMDLGFSDAPYIASGAIPNVRITSDTLPMHLMTGAYRAPCYNSHVFAVETFIDECAVAAGMDPLAYRLKLLEFWDPTWRKCLEIAAEKIEWGRTLPQGEGLGIAISNWPRSGMKQTGATVCTAAHVAVSPEGLLRVKQLDVTFDCGRVVNSDAVIAQVEGGVIFGMNMTLNEEITLRDGEVVETNFHQYPMVRLADMPILNVHLDALSGHDRFAIIGEAPVGPVGPAIGNAIFQATGKRLRSTPFRKHDLSWG